MLHLEAVESQAGTTRPSPAMRVTGIFGDFAVAEAAHQAISAGPSYHVRTLWGYQEISVELVPRRIMRHRFLLSRKGYSAKALRGLWYSYKT
ncbi:DUF2563 family protein [Mycobacterium xenopi]|uniref:Uncharacterized protein n=2 Tax=Mycobacterium xenopi TaxID=1789 RepID=A0A2X1T3B9_MYCXE|nr:DUF2563 family protein [Mycobacterium xenopi]MDA3642319.1 DUF2563 family protein [Mycobacterium xenopi]MDA3660376.1 DUF2563 family protein [Mycobacterium xenopi]MDA3664958.1 DUF2563 family protein [Mycobacterium xenopi]SPX89944.1 Uncharacterised protein [Mycobacterium xenopi]SPX89965.1 Uncharacterised protein [Mycobacterium xenopi]